MVIHLLIALLSCSFPVSNKGIGFEMKDPHLFAKDLSDGICRNDPFVTPLLEENLNTHPTTGCLLTRWGVPSWTLEIPAAFIAGHILGYAIWVPMMFTFWDAGGYDFVKLALAGRYFLGVPAGAALGTIASGAMIDQGGTWGSAFKGAFLGDLCVITLTAGYCLIFGDPWEYGPGDEPPSVTTIDPFVKIFLPVVSIIPAASAVFWYDSSIPKVPFETPDTMSYRSSWTRHVRETSLSERHVLDGHKLPLSLTIVSLRF